MPFGAGTTLVGLSVAIVVESSCVADFAGLRNAGGVEAGEQAGSRAGETARRAYAHGILCGVEDAAGGGSTGSAWDAVAALVDLTVAVLVEAGGVADLGRAQALGDTLAGLAGGPLGARVGNGAQSAAVAAAVGISVRSALDPAGMETRLARDLAGSYKALRSAEVGWRGTSSAAGTTGADERVVDAEVAAIVGALGARSVAGFGVWNADARALLHAVGTGRDTSPIDAGDGAALGGGADGAVWSARVDIGVAATAVLAQVEAGAA